MAEIHPNNSTVKENESKISNIDVERFHYKLWIASICAIEKHPFHANAGYFRGRLVTFVDIVGSVVSKGANAKLNLLKLDDGSGIVMCKFYKDSSKSEQIQKFRDAIHNDSSMMLISNQQDDGLGTLLNLLAEEIVDYPLGATLNVQGRLSFYQGQWELFGNTVRLVSFDEESYRCIELDHLYRNLYKPE